MNLDSWNPDDLMGLFVALILLFILTIFIYLIYSGLLTSFTVSTSEPDSEIFGRSLNEADEVSKDGAKVDKSGVGGGSNGIVVAYKAGRGPYKGSAVYYTEAFCLAPEKPTIGIFYDEADSTPASELRYAVGSIISDQNQEFENADLMSEFLKHGFKIAHFPRPEYVVSSSFPFTTTLSIYFAIFKVYPRLKSYISSRGLCAYPAVEVYKKDSIYFMLPLSRQDEFFVPEFGEEEVSLATTEVSSFVGERDEQIIADDDALFVKPKIPKASFSSRQPQASSNTHKSSNIPEEDKGDNEDELERSDSASSFEDIGAKVNEEDLKALEEES